MKKEYFTKVTIFSKIIAMLLFVGLPFIGFYFGKRYQKMTTILPSPTLYPVTQQVPEPMPTNEYIDPKLLKENHPFKDYDLGISINFPSNWPVLYIDRKLIAISQYTPYPVVVTPNITKVDYDLIDKGKKLGKTIDGAVIYENAEGHSGPSRYLVIYPDKTTYEWYFEATSLSGPPKGWTDGIWNPEVNFTDKEILGVIEASKRINN